MRAWAVRRLYRACREENTSHARARQLLRAWLSPHQKMQFEANGHFDVVGCHSGKRYRIRRGTSANINELDGNGHLGPGWCFVPAGALAEGDVMLAQKIALETNEQGALDVANSFPGPMRWRGPFASHPRSHPMAERAQPVGQDASTPRTPLLTY